MNIVSGQASARRMLAKLNLTVTITPTVPKGTAAASPISVAAGSFPIGRMDDRFSKDAKVRERQRLLYVAALDTAGASFADPKSDDMVAGLEGVPWRVLGNSPFRPDGATTVWHELVLQR